jgi:two-component system, NarL family, nitrate/nitrite response regulator NarL
MDTNSNPCRVLIADDHPGFRDAVRRMLEAEASFTVVGQASEGAEAAQKARQLKPDVLLLDLAMPSRSGIEALRDLASSPSPIRTIVLTAAIDRFQLVEALRLGAYGVVLKDSATEVLSAAIRGVMSGHYWVAREMVDGLIEALRSVVSTPSRSPQKKFGLTERELGIVETVVAGYSNRDIASRFSISQQTVKHHLSSIFDKIGVSSRLEVAVFAINHGLVKRQ